MSDRNDRSKADPDVSCRLALWRAEDALHDFVVALFAPLAPFDREAHLPIFGPLLDRLESVGDALDRLRAALVDEARREP